jgi:hypothetical protein
MFIDLDINYTSIGQMPCYMPVIPTTQEGEFGRNIVVN